MKRTFNFTGRSRISRETVDIRLSDDGSSFTVDLGEELKQFPNGAVAIVEAYERTTYERHTLGKLPEKLNRGPFTLDQVPGDAALFRVKVIGIEAEQKGLLLGVADRISPVSRPDLGDDEQNGQRVALLHARPAALEGAVWRLTLDSERFPMLEYEAQLSAHGFSQFIKADVRFQTLVMPEIVRQIVTHILIIDDLDGAGDGSWQAEWLKLASSWVNISAPEAGDDLEDKQLWINDVVAAFSHRSNALQGVHSFLVEGPS